MRRATGLLLMLSLFQLSVLDVRAECERHAPKSGSPTATGEHAHHPHHAGHAVTPATDSKAPVPAPSSTPTPKCCMVGGSCVSNSFASVMQADELGATPQLDAASLIARLRSSPDRTPDPPPPKA